MPKEGDPVELSDIVRRAQDSIDRDEAVEIKQLPNGTEMLVLTSSGSLYEIAVCDAQTNCAEIKGGIFDKLIKVRIVGATMGSSSSIWLDRIAKDYNLEFVVLDTKETVRTSAIKHITIRGIRSLGEISKA